MFASVSLLILLAVLVSTGSMAPDPRLYLPMSTESCHHAILSLQSAAAPKLHDWLSEMADWSAGQGSLVKYLHMHILCFQHTWNSCLSPQTIEVVKSRHIWSTFLCYSFRVDARSNATLLHTITTMPSYQINLTFTEFLLRRSLTGCTSHHIKVWHNRSHCQTFGLVVGHVKVDYVKYRKNRPAMANGNLGQSTIQMSSDNATQIGGYIIMILLKSRLIFYS